MKKFYQYVIDCFTLSDEAKRMLDSIAYYAFVNFSDCGHLTEEGTDFLMEIVGDNIGMDRAEIIENWGEEK